MKEITRQRGVSMPAFIAVILIGGIVIVIGAVYVGKSDNGEINVESLINSSNQQNEASGNSDKNVGTTPAALRDLPNGGLVPQDPNATPPAPESEQLEEDESDVEGGVASDEDVESEAGPGEVPEA